MNTTSVTIDRNKAIELLERVVAERGGDFMYSPKRPAADTGKYNTCNYEFDGVPSCGIGLALSYLGVSAEDLAELDTQGGNADETGIGNIPVRNILEHRHNIVFDKQGLDIFKRFQMHQDNKVNYRTALTDALAFPPS